MIRLSLTCVELDHCSTNTGLTKAFWRVSPTISCHHLSFPNIKLLTHSLVFTNESWMMMLMINGEVRANEKMHTCLCGLLGKRAIRKHQAVCCCDRSGIMAVRLLGVGWWWDTPTDLSIYSCETCLIWQLRLYAITKRGYVFFSYIYNI